MGPMGPMGTHGNPWGTMETHGTPWLLTGPHGDPRQLWGSFFPFLGREISQKVKNRKIKKPYMKVVWDSCLWDSGRWDGCGIILGWIPFFFASFGRAKRRKHYVCLLFYQYWTWAQKSQWSRHLFEKSIPGLFYSKPHRKVNATTLELVTTNFKNL